MLQFIKVQAPTEEHENFPKVGAGTAGRGRNFVYFHIPFLSSHMVRADSLCT